MKLNITAFNRLHCMHHAICDESIFTRTSTDNSNKYLLLVHDDDVMWRSNTVQDLDGGVVSFCRSCHCCQAILRCLAPVRLQLLMCHLTLLRPTLGCHWTPHARSSLVASDYCHQETNAPPPPPIFVMAFFHLCDFNLPCESKRQWTCQSPRFIILQNVHAV